MTNNSTSPAAIAARVIETEIDGLRALTASIGPEFEKAARLVIGLDGRVILAGVGKSGHVARKIAATLASTGTPSTFIHPTEASHGDLGMITDADSVLALSKSGDTRELADLIAHCRRFSIPLIAMTSGPDSVLARQADIALLTPDAHEACAETFAPTTSTTIMMALGDALAVAVLEMRGFSAADFRAFHPGGALGGLLASAGDLMHGGDALPLVGADASMEDVLIVMSEKSFGCAGVVEDARLRGIITDGDLRRHMGPDLLQRTAGDVMTRDPRTVSPSTLAADVLRLMTTVEPRVLVMFVVDDSGAPVGVIHMHDCLRAGVA